MFLDTNGDLYFSDQANKTIRVITRSGVLSTFAGIPEGGFYCSGGFAGDGGPAAKAKFRCPAGLARDRAGNLYIADAGNERIRVVDSSGIVSTFAGTGTTAFAGDGGSRLEAEFRLGYNSGAAVDGDGNVYVADSANNRIRRISPGGLVTTVAGNGNEAYSGDGGPAAQASLRFPAGLFLDRAGNLYVADEGNNRIRKITGLSAPDMVAATPNRVEIAVDEGAPAPDARTVQIVSSGAQTPFTAAVTSGEWLKLETAAGRTPGALRFRVHNADLKPGVYTGAIRATTTGNRVRAVDIAVTLTVKALPPPPPVLAAENPVVNAASLLPGNAAPGTALSITGLRLVAAEQSWQPGAPLPFELGGVRVTMDGQPAPVVFASPARVTIIVPWVSVRGSARLELTSGTNTVAAWVNVESFAPALYMQETGGRKYVKAQHPAAPGESILLYATGLGDTDPAVSFTEALAAPVPVANPVTVTIGGESAEVTHAVLVQPGVYEIKAAVPAGLGAGDHEAIGEVAGYRTQPDVYLAVQPPE